MRRLLRLVLPAVLPLVAACAAAPLPVGQCTYPHVGATRPTIAYDVEALASADGSELCVEAKGTRASMEHLRVPERLAPFVRDAAAERDGHFVPMGPGFSVACDARDCRVRYRVLLKNAARFFRDRDLALLDHGEVFSPASTWILRPDRAPSGALYRVHVTTPTGLTFVNGLFHARDGAVGAYEGAIADLDHAPYAAFGRFDVRTLKLGASTLEIAFTEGSTGVPRERVVEWITSSARAVERYYGGFPIPRALVVVLAGEQGNVAHGMTMGDGGAAVVLEIGRDTTEADLKDDWIFVHEMVHVAFPSVLKPWAEEGLATYVEPLIRARAGLLDRDELWRSMVLGLPQGLPEKGDEGLENTDTWGRRYWGGALFWFMADIEIRERAQNRRSLDDALRAVTHAGGNVAVTWDLRRVFGIGEAATGTPVFGELYRSMALTPTATDLDALWKRLGIDLVHGRIIYDDAAPLASIRRGIAGE